MEPSAIEKALADIGNLINTLRTELDELKAEKGSKALIDQIKADLDTAKREKNALLEKQRKDDEERKKQVITPEPEAIDPIDPLGLLD